MEWHTMRNLGRCYFRHLPALVSYIFLVLFSYILTQVADPEQSNSLWSTDWLRGERGTLHFFLLIEALVQPLPFLPKQVGCDYGTLLCPYMYQQDPSVFPISAGMSCYECLCKLGR